MYWMAAIIADEDYAFEPYLASLYGPCGVIAHYNPIDATRSLTSSSSENNNNHRLMYMNAEWVLEKISSIGHGKTLFFSFFSIL
jgi:hypothetical protein